MDTVAIIPHYQPLPFPAPVWLLQTLLVLGFFLHAIPMNVVLAGTPASGLLLWLGRKDRTSNCYRLGKTLACALPLFISVAVTQGIVPLLFLQLLYGPMYYTSSVLMAVPWLSVIFFLLVGYYSSYVVIYRHLKASDSKQPGVAAPAIMFVASLVFLTISFFFVNNMTLMIMPENWLRLYQTGASGFHLPLAHQQLWPRWLHFLVSAIAVTGLAIASIAAFGKSPDQEHKCWLLKKGAHIFAGATALQIPIGALFLFSLPRQVMLKFVGGDLPATAVFTLSMILILTSIGLAVYSARSGKTVLFKWALSSAMLLVLLMVLLRHLLRAFLVSPYIVPDSVPVQTQWDLLIVFVLTAVALVVYLVWLVRLAWRAYHPGADEGTPVASKGAEAL
jgi:hypothetical protein